MAKMLVSTWDDVFKTGLVKLEFVQRTAMKGLNTVIWKYILKGDYPREERRLGGV